MTGQEMTARVLQRTDEDPAAPVSCTTAEALAAINEGQELFALLTLCIEHTATFSLPAGKAYLLVRGSLPDYLVPLRVTINGARVFPGRFADFDAENPAWQKTAGTPTRYCAVGFNLLLFNRAPVEDKTVTVVYAAAPGLLVSDTWPDVPEAYHQSITDYGVYRVRGPKAGGALLTGALPYLNRFLDDAGKYADFVRARSRAQNYDVQPFELQLFDRSRLTGATK